MAKYTGVKVKGEFDSERALLAEPTRLKIIMYLAKRSYGPTQLAVHIKKSYLAIHYHLKILLAANLIEKLSMGEKGSRFQDYRISTTGKNVLEAKGIKIEEILLAEGV